MTVNELLEKMAKAFPYFRDAEAETWGPVFRRQMRAHEGDALRQAWEATLAAFKPTARQTFPIPIDFEQHLPSSHPKIKADGKKIDFDKQRAHKHAIVEEWAKLQYDKILQERGPLVANYIMRQVADLAWTIPEDDRYAFITLDEEKIHVYEDQLVSQARLALHGAAALRADDGGALWRKQTEECRTLIRAGINPLDQTTAAEKRGTSTPSDAMRSRMTELAKKFHQPPNYATPPADDGFEIPEEPI